MSDMLIACYSSGQIEEREWQMRLNENAQLQEAWLAYQQKK